MSENAAKKNSVMRKIVTALLCLLTAFALWTYVVTVVGPEYKDTFRDIPVSYIGMSDLQDKGLMLISEGTPKVTLELSGNRSDLNKLSPANISVTVDLSKIELPGKNALNYSVSYPVNVTQDAVTVQNGSPAGIVVEIVRRKTKEIPVKVETLGTMPEDYIKEKPELELETIRISGPEDVVDRIEEACIQIELNEETKSTITGEFTYTLVDADHEPVDAKYIQVAGEEAQTITVTIPIKRTKEIPLVIKIIPGGGATEHNSSIVIDPQTIQISGSEAALEGLEMLEIGTIDLSSVLTEEVKKFPIVLPEGITNETGIAEATVTISFPTLETRTLSVTQFELINVPEGMNVTVNTKVVDVQIRGTKVVLNELDAEDVIITVDCSGAEVGNQRLECSVTVKGTTDAGALGTYPILVTIAEENG